MTDAPLPDRDPDLDAKEAFDPDQQLVLVVTGAHLRAEVGDRPLAYRVKQRIEAWQKRHARRLNVRIQPVVCTDLWYLNNEELQRLPTLSVGGPGVNALSALFAKQLPEEESEAIEEMETDPLEDAEEDEDEQEDSQPPAGQPKVVIQIDPDFTDLRACIWGTDHDLTAAGVRLFTRRYLGGFLTAVATQIEPRE